MKRNHRLVATALLVVLSTSLSASAQQSQPRSSAAQTIPRATVLGQPTASPYLIQEIHPEAIQQTAPRAMPMPAHVEYQPAPAIQSHRLTDSSMAVMEYEACDCQQPSCHRCRLRSRRSAGCDSCGTDCGSVQCPRCEGDVCKLELDKSKVKKTCFKVEQVPVCIPPVRFPWQECCPPGTAKTRLVNKLKVHKYECPGCSYKWTLQEPEKESTEPTEAKKDEPQQAPTKEGDVPAAPAIKGAFRNLFQSKR